MPALDSEWSAEDGLSLARQGAALRRVANGQPATYAGKEYRLVLSAITTRRDPEAGGFEVMPSFVARVDVAKYPDFAPVLGAALTVLGVEYKIVEIAKATLAGEIRLALAKA